MSLKIQKRLAASLLGGGFKRVWLVAEVINRVQSSINGEDSKCVIR